jgi:hypothetical protein
VCQSPVSTQLRGDHIDGLTVPADPQTGPEHPPVAGVAEAFVADLAGFDVARAAGRTGDWCGAGERSWPGCGGEARGSSPISARTLAARMGPSPGADCNVDAIG